MCYYSRDSALQYILASTISNQGFMHITRLAVYSVSRLMSQEPNFLESQCFSQRVGCLLRCPAILNPPVDSEAKPFVLYNQDRYDITISTTEKKWMGEKNPDAKMNTIQFRREAYPLKIALSSWCDFLSLYRDFFLHKWRQEMPGV